MCLVYMSKKKCWVYPFGIPAFNGRPLMEKLIKTLTQSNARLLRWWFSFSIGG